MSERYFETKDHLENFLRKRVRENPQLDVNKLLNIVAYVEILFSSQLSDRFSWDVQKDPSLLEESKFLGWLQENKLANWTLDAEIEHEVTSEFVKTLSELVRIPGVYSFWSGPGIPLYVGMSVNLADRAESSFKERFRNYGRTIFFRYIVTKTGSDASVLESFFIAKLKPAFNFTGKYADALTLEIEAAKWSEPIMCNTVHRVMED